MVIKEMSIEKFSEIFDIFIQEALGPDKPPTVKQQLWDLLVKKLRESGQIDSSK